jgi:hypothetical protein
MYWFPHKYTRAMIQYIKDNYNSKELVGCEIGVREGNNLRNIMEVLKPKKMFAIDITFELLEYKNKKVFYWEIPSVLASKHIYGEVDFVYIDANHDYDSVYDDIQYWYPKIKKGGVIGGHDINYYGVKKAVNVFFNKKDINIKDWDWWVIKK